LSAGCFFCRPRQSGETVKEFLEKLAEFPSAFAENYAPMSVGEVIADFFGRVHAPLNGHHSWEGRLLTVRSSSDELPPLIGSGYTSRSTSPFHGGSYGDVSDRLGAGR
jgi:hypothetical protein